MTTMDNWLGGAVLVGDGGTGSLLLARRPRLRFPEEANLVAAEDVLAVHLEFIRAGADVIQTNTFGANPVKLGIHRYDDEADQINAAGAKIAREAREVAGRDVAIAGSIGPLGTSVEYIGATTSNAAALYGRQAAVLEGRGVDLLILETFTSPEELLAAIDSVRAQCGLPIVATISVDDEGETPTGVASEDVALALAGTGVAAIGINCSLGPQSALAGLQRMRLSGAGTMLAVQPNIGLPEYRDGRVLYPDATDSYAAEFAAQALAAGARLIGGCCGTQPHHIAAIRRAVDERRPAELRFAARREPPPPVLAPDDGRSRFAERLDAGEWVTSVEVDPPKGASLERLISVVSSIAAETGVEFFDVNDNPMARARMSSLIAAGLLEARLGIETIPHLTPRDATGRGLESLLLGAGAAGIRNVLAVTGDQPAPAAPVAGRADPALDSIGLLELIDALNHGTDRAGKHLDLQTSFFIGAALNPTAEDLDLEIERYERKVAAGARFVMTQVLFDLAPLEALERRLGRSPAVPVIVGLWPVTSHALALRLHNEVPGITVPDAVLGQLARAEGAAAREGVAVARELLAQARELCAGAYLVAPFGQPERVIDVLS